MIGQLGREGLDGQLKADLVVALAGAAVADGVGALRFGDLHDALGDDRARAKLVPSRYSSSYTAPACMVG